MSLKYALYNTPVPGHGKGTGGKHARLIPDSTVNMEMMCELVSESCSFSAADVKGVLTALAQWRAIYLRGGSYIHLEGLGYFYPTLRSREVTDETGRKTIRVWVDTIGFRCAPVLKKKIRKAKPAEVKRSATLFSAQKRQKRIEEYIKSHLCMTGNDAMRLNSCSHYMALKDLKKLLAEGKLRLIGNPGHMLFIRNNKDDRQGRL